MTEFAPTPLQFIEDQLVPGELWTATVRQARMDEGGLRALAQISAGTELMVNPEADVHQTNRRLFRDSTIKPPLNSDELTQVGYGTADMAIVKRFVLRADLGLTTTGGN